MPNYLPFHKMGIRLFRFRKFGTQSAHFSICGNQSSYLKISAIKTRVVMLGSIPVSTYSKTLFIILFYNDETDKHLTQTGPSTDCRTGCSGTSTDPLPRTGTLWGRPWPCTRTNSPRASWTWLRYGYRGRYNCR